MFRRTWWTRRCVRWSGLAFVILVAVIVWVSGTEDLFVGQPLDEAKAALWRAGARDVTSSTKVSYSVQILKRSDIRYSYWELQDGRTVFVLGSRESPDEPYRLARLPMWQEWCKFTNGVANKFPETDTLRLRRSVFAFVPAWGW
jgi:hypothetical protein